MSTHLTLEASLPLLSYLVPASLAWLAYWRVRAGRTRRALRRLREAEEAQLLEPPSLHPHINPNRCAGCCSCIDACHEGDVLGLVDGKARLVSPADCIGHGACKEACPMDAITLVFGTATRGVDIPLVGTDFETNVPGLFIAGELGGMGLIRNAVEQGRQAIESIRRRASTGGRFDHDVVIVGAGPAGFAATLAARERRLRSVTIEQETLGGAVAHYPRGKIVMTAPMQLPLYGRVKLRETTKEALLALWRQVEESTGIQIHYRERLEQIAPVGAGFEVRTTRARYRTRSVLLAIGRRGTPRKLGVQGEELPKVVYRLIEPEQYRGQRVLVVGGGDSALEAALALAAQDGTSVTLSYRGAAFGRARPANRERFEAARRAGALQARMESQVREILPECVRLDQRGAALELANDAVVVCAGGVLPTGLLRALGIEVETKYGVA
jgi:thioredoxin reductase/NAD-dependent dihydropyrimidine dehydrogenase PreA subunit